MTRTSHLLMTESLTSDVDMKPIWRGTDCQGPSPNRKLSAGRSESSIIYPVTMPAARRRTATEAEIQFPKIHLPAILDRSHPTKRAIVLCSEASNGVDYAKVERCGGLDEVWGGEGVGVMVMREKGRKQKPHFVVCNFASSLQVLFVLNGIDRIVF